MRIDKRSALALGGTTLALLAAFSWLGLQGSAPARAAGSLFAIGLLLGSFLNVLAFRLPKMMEQAWQREAAEACGLPPPEQAPLSLSHPHSHCPGCRNTLKTWQLVPVFSYLLLRGRCAFCASPISPRYPLVELSVGLIFAAVGWRLGPSPASLAHLVLLYLLLALALIDLDSKLLPDSLTQPLLWLGLLANLFQSLAPLQDAVIGAMAGYLSMWLIAAAFRLCTGKEGLGIGDFKLMAALGAWLGWEALPLIITIGSISSALVGIALIVAKRTEREQTQPFGPFLIAGGIVALLWGKEITRWYLALA
ncbi:prepilin peptidase [Chromobacterium subtsugae]|uniref:prepilin peptidase n=1 Tax=Chromobacterium subtsugae TaxID=251747 RepID=UPI0009BBBD6C|nr:A24 family peptidase [Chromobacterium subtsugae]